jgi:uncharacterized protein involved in response to NO
MTDSGERDIPFLSYGFRVFFLFAGVYAIAAIGAWLVWLGLQTAGAAVSAQSFAGDPQVWHGHEMIFGYAVAALAGFMLTALPSWTGARPVTDLPLAALAAVWLSGRLALWFSAFVPALLVAVIDLAFLPLFAAFVARSLMLKPAPRNLVFLALLGLLFAANLAVHLEWLGQADNGAAWGLGLGIVTLGLMVAIIGGRIVPAFTRNALMRAGESERLPRSLAPIEAVSLIGSAGVVLCYLADAPDWLTGTVAAVAALAHLARLGLWRSGATLGEPIVWSLHLAYLWLPIGYAAIAAARLLDAFPEAFALHALGVGAIGGMTLAVMTRAALGHTGRPLAVTWPIALSYVLVTLAALVRVFAPVVFSVFFLELILVAGVLWMIGFGVFVVAYWPILTGPPLSAGGKV